MGTGERGDRNVAAASGGGLDWGSSAPEREGMKRATYEDVLNAPENKVAEILDGELVLSPRPTYRHARAQSALFGQLWRPFDQGQGGPGGWWLLTEPELHFGEAVVVPDVGGWRRERLPEIPDRPWLDLAPDWVCEVLSPSTERIDRSRKLRIYAEAGVAHAWLVNPLQPTLEVLRLKDGVWTIVRVLTGTEAVPVEPFEAVPLDLRVVWGDPPTSE